MIECGECGKEFDPIASRWLCPFCGHKESCCEGEASDMKYQNELIAALTECGREKDIPYFTGKEYGTSGHSIPEPFEITYSDGITATHFAGRVEKLQWKT